MLNEARLEYVECDSLGAATQLHRFGSRALKATVVEPFVALARMSSASLGRTGNAAMLANVSPTIAESASNSAASAPGASSVTSTFRHSSMPKAVDA